MLRLILPSQEGKLQKPRKFRFSAMVWNVNVVPKNFFSECSMVNDINIKGIVRPIPCCVNLKFDHCNGWY